MLSAPIAVFFALKNESGYFEDRLENAEHIFAHGFRLVSGTLNGLEFLSVVTGMGIQNARSVVETVCQIHRPRLVVSAGFAGGLDVSLPRGGIFLANEILPESVLVGGGKRVGRESSSENEYCRECAQGAERENTPEAQFDSEKGLGENDAVSDFQLAEAARISVSFRLKTEDLPTELRSICRIGGRLLTVSKTAGTPDFKRELAVGYRTLAVDMESWGVAGVCRERRLPFLSVRAISDAANEVLPRDVQKLVDQKTMASRAGAALQLLFQRPGCVKDLYRLYDSSVECALNLADFLTAFSQMKQLDFLSENFFPPQEPGKALK